MICENCGAYVNDGDTFCGECGSKVAQPSGVQKGNIPYQMPTATAPEVKRKSGNKSIIIIASAAVVIVAAVFAVLLAMNVISFGGTENVSSKNTYREEKTVTVYQPDERQTIWNPLSDGQLYGNDGYENYTNAYSAAQTGRYRVVAKDVDWYGAKAECELAGGHLATITSQEEFDEICRLARQSGLTYIWLGARIYSTNDEFSTWITGENMSFSKWFPGEPSKADTDGTEEFFLCLWNVKYNGENVGWTFNDQRNDMISESPAISGKLGYIIEYDN